LAALPEHGADEENEQTDGSLNMATKISEPPSEVMSGGSEEYVHLVADDAFEKVPSHAVEKLQAANRGLDDLATA
jgi:hypothetical protein